MVQQFHLPVVDLELDPQLRHALEDADSVGEPHRRGEQIVGFLLEFHFLQDGRAHTRDFLDRQIDVGKAQEHPRRAQAEC